MKYPYRYGRQFERYVRQVMRVFSGFRVQDGVSRNPDDPAERKMMNVPVVYGAMDRVTATVLQGRDSFQANRLPLMAINLSSIEPDSTRKKSHSHIDAMTVRNDDGASGKYRLVGPPFNLKMELSIYASSTDELFQILEQIFLIFNPRVKISISTDPYNSDYVSEISLENVSNEIQYPMGQSPQLVMTSLSFNVPIRLRYPYEADGSYIDQIKANILAGTPDDHIPLDELVVGGE